MTANLDGQSDVLISVTLTLFMLSLVTEKISNLIKMYFPSFYIKNEDPIEENKRSRKIMLLTGSIGIMVAFLYNADFFQMIKENGNIEPFTLPTFTGAIGCIVTGIFLSQGSKFFHDLLDTILYFKDAKRALSTRQDLQNKLISSRINLIEDEMTSLITPSNRHDQEEDI